MQERERYRYAALREIYTGEIISTIFNCEHDEERHTERERGEEREGKFTVACRYGACNATTVARFARSYLADAINN